jgi:hypothetical protein
VIAGLDDLARHPFDAARDRVGVECEQRPRTHRAILRAVRGCDPILQGEKKSGPPTTPEQISQIFIDAAFSPSQERFKGSLIL